MSKPTRKQKAVAWLIVAGTATAILACGIRGAVILTQPERVPTAFDVVCYGLGILFYLAVGGGIIFGLAVGFCEVGLWVLWALETPAEEPKPAPDPWGDGADERGEF